MKHVLGHVGENKLLTSCSSEIKVKKSKDFSKKCSANATLLSFVGKKYPKICQRNMVLMQACSLLLGRPWEFDNDATHKQTYVVQGS